LQGIASTAKVGWALKLDKKEEEEEHELSGKGREIVRGRVRRIEERERWSSRVDKCWWAAR
jgi:hypothetical protein